MAKHDPNPPLTEKQLKEIKELYDQCLDDGEIAEKMKLLRSIVSFHRRDLELDKILRTFTDQQFIDLHAKELNDGEIGNELKITSNMALHHRVRLELKTHMSRCSFPDQQLIDLHAQGLNDIEIAEETGAHRNTVGDRRRGLGLKTQRELRSSRS